MSVLVESTESVAVIHPNRKRWTRAEVQQLIDEGHHEFERYELFDGELIDKMGKNWPHVSVVRTLTILLQERFGNEFVLSEAPISLRPEDNATYRPEPDLVVLTKSYKSLFDDPDPGEILFAVEVSDTSLRFDLAAKAKAYARAGIGEYWVADLPGRRMIVHRLPIDGRYTFVEALKAGESVSPGALPDVSIPVDSIFS